LNNEAMIAIVLNFFGEAFTGYFQLRLKLRQCKWRHLKVMVENVTTARAVVNLAGPNARTILAEIGINIDLSADGVFRPGSSGCASPERCRTRSPCRGAIPWRAVA
jgi:hypothetical protein